MNTDDVTVYREDELWVADIAGMAADTATARRGMVRLEIIQRVNQLVNAS
jgi:hypothetical protein